MLRGIFLAPPLAFARVGASKTPCSAYNWADNDISPRGLGQTTLEPALTLSVDSEGNISSEIPAEIVFRDEQGIRTVCPFFELHAEYLDDQGEPHTGPVTLELLESWGLGLSDVSWGVELANLKAYHYTRQAGDRVEAKLNLADNEHQRVTISGSSPVDSSDPLVRADRPIAMGEVQLPRPNSQFPELRLHFIAPAGLIYGPEDLDQRLAELDPAITGNADWREFSLPAERHIVNPSASWPRYVPSLATVGPFNERDYRNTPGGLLAAPISPIPGLPDDDPRERALGLVDDVSDGLVTCEVSVGGQTFTATARVVVGPPDFAPANRPPVSLADNLADRELRDDARQFEGTSEDLTSLVLDIFERAFETSDLMHRDYQNFRSIRTNGSEFAGQGGRATLDPEDLEALLWPPPDVQAVTDGLSHGMPIVDAGTRQHRRHNAVEIGRASRRERV